jgi:hypothetical protein
MRTLRMRIVTRRILRHRITIENSNILANFRIKLKSLESLFYGLIRLDLCKKNRRRKSHSWAPLSHTWGLHLFKQQSRRQRPCSSYANGDFTEASSATTVFPCRTGAAGLTSPRLEAVGFPSLQKLEEVLFGLMTSRLGGAMWPEEIHQRGLYIICDSWSVKICVNY